MLKKIVEFENYDGVKAKKTLWFHFTKAEVMEMEMKGNQGLFAKIKQIVNADTEDEIIDIFKELVLKAYGVRDGNDFIKTQDLRDRFASSEAYSELFIELATNAEAAVEFFSGIMPKGLEAVAEKISQQPDISQAEIDAMMRKALEDQGKLSKSSASVINMTPQAEVDIVPNYIPQNTNTPAVSQEPIANGPVYNEHVDRVPDSMV